MINQTPPYSDVTELELLPHHGIELSQAQIDQAIQISQPIANPRRRWQTYLHALAVFGFEEWLAGWAPDLTINDSHCSTLQPAYANLMEAACNVQVGSFKLCLLATGSLMDTVVGLPRAAIDLPAFIPHLYVLVEVLEEAMQVQVYGYLRYDQLLLHQQSHALRLISDWTYGLPLDWFTLDSDALLLDLTCLESSVIALSASPAQVLGQAFQAENFAIAPPTALANLIPVDQLRSRLTDLLPQLRQSQHLPEQLLTWEEGASLLSYPDLVDWLQQELHSDSPTPHASPLSPLPRSNLTQHAINAGQWLQNQLDTVAQELSWVLMPPRMNDSFALRSGASSFNSEAEEFEQIITAMESQGITIPFEARGAYQDFHWEGPTLRLHAVTWALFPTSGEPEWTLLVLLGTRDGADMPVGIRLQVQDAMQTLEERISDETTQYAYLCTQVVGTWSEQFQVTIELTDGVIIAPPPFAFCPEPLS